MSETLTHQETTSYRQMVEKLGAEGVAMLKDQLTLWSELNKKELASPLRDALRRGDITLPEGTLLHGMGMYGYDADAVRGVSEMGIVSGELIGVTEDAETHGCADFFRVPRDTNIGAYFDSAKELVTVDSLRIQRGERLLTRGVVFIVDAQAEGVPELLENDGYRKEEMSGFVSPPLMRTPEDTSAILGGVPRGAIAGVVVSDRLLASTDVAQVLSGCFPDVPVFNQTGIPLQAVA